MSKHLNGVGFNVATTGQGTIDVGTRINNSFALPSEVGGVTTETYTWRLQDGLDVEVFRGVYTDAAPDTVSRVTVLFSIIAGVKGTDKLDLSGSGVTCRAVLVADDVQRASVAEVRDPSVDDKFPTVKDLYDGAAAVAKTSTAASIAMDLDTGIKFTHTATENTTLANPTNKVVGKSWSLEWTQHASAPKTLAYGGDYTTAEKAAELPTVTPANSALDTLYFECLASGKVLVTAVLNHD